MESIEKRDKVKTIVLCDVRVSISMKNKSSSFAKANKRRKKLADFFPIYFNIYKDIKKRGM
ncbi:hypothetical protein ABFE25_30835 [Bacillus toyonensis]|uniref:hypothetical protein n=1 Tax=Bacillus toyonensis TaxID=155322 RepID=UPI00321A9DC3